MTTPDNAPPPDGGTPPAPPSPPPAEPGKTVKARVLVDCQHGQIDDIVALPSAVAKAAAEAGLVDTHKDAVAYAASLKKAAAGE